MQKFSTNLFLEINNLEFVFVVGVLSENDDFKILYKNSTPIQGIKEKKITDPDVIQEIIKENIFLIEQDLNVTFKEVILILDNFNYSVFNISGFKKLNGAQLNLENVTYILNSLKSTIHDQEKNKSFIHIFNSNYLLDKKKVENLPIGLFGELYSHELTFFLIYNNEYKNLENIFSNCSLRIKKILFKSFIEGVDLIDTNHELHTFFKISIKENISELIFFENSALKFVQNFNFGTSIIVNDIVKILSIKKDIIEKFLFKNVLDNTANTEDHLEKEYFDNGNFRKIKKKLIYDIASARIQELAEIIKYKNVNLKSFFKTDSPVFLQVDNDNVLNCFKHSFFNSFSQNQRFKVKLFKKSNEKSYFYNAFKVVHFGWKKEAVPVIQTKKSLIARFFDLLFN